MLKSSDEKLKKELHPKKPWTKTAQNKTSQFMEFNLVPVC